MSEPTAEPAVTEPTAGDLILAFLKDGQWHPFNEILEKVVKISPERASQIFISTIPKAKREAAKSKFPIEHQKGQGNKLFIMRPLYNLTKNRIIECQGEEKGPFDRTYRLLPPTARKAPVKKTPRPADMDLLQRLSDLETDVCKHYKSASRIEIEDFKAQMRSAARFIRLFEKEK